MISVTLYYHGVRIKPFMCAKCMALWITLIYLVVKKLQGAEMEWFFVFALSLTAAALGVVFEKWMMKR